MSIALLVIDVQKKYVSQPAFKETFAMAKEYINYVSDLFRKAQQPVIHILHVEPEENIESDDFQVSEEIVQKDGDIYLHKHYGNGFWKTDLQKILEDHGIEFVVCSGLAAAYCVLATYNGALERGFGAAMLQSGLVGNSWDEVRTVQRERAVISYNSVKYILDLLKKK